MVAVWSGSIAHKIGCSSAEKLDNKLLQAFESGMRKNLSQSAGPHDPVADLMASQDITRCHSHSWVPRLTASVNMHGILGRRGAVSPIMLKDQANEQLDAKGLVCPEPLMLVRNKIRTMATAEVLYVEATDPTTRRDLDNFCRFMGHDMLSHSTQGQGPEQIFEFWIKKA